MLSLAILLTALFAAADPDRDFSGKWVFDHGASRPGTLAGGPEPALVVVQRGSILQCGPLTHKLDGNESVSQVGRDKHNSATKWEGSALLINDLVSGPSTYVVAERWKLSRDRGVLTIKRQVSRGSAETEGVLVYRREGWQPAAAPRVPESIAPSAPVTVPAGTRILLELVNSVDTRHSREGDRIYLQTAAPVFLKGRTVVPRGSAVAGTVTSSKRPGRVAGRGELFVLFDSLTLPNGTTRELRSRMDGAGAEVAGDLDRREGKLTSPDGKAGDGRTVAKGAEIGAAAGGITGVATGSTGKGLGIGAAAGAAAGLTSVLLKRGPDAILPKGATVEMVLDRDLQFREAELP